MPKLRQLATSLSRQVPELSWPSCYTQIQIHQLAYHLRDHPDQEFATFVLQGLSHGFHIGFSCTSTRLHSAVRNHPSAMTNQVIANFISEETAAGRMVGPLPALVAWCSPVGLVPKGRGTGRWQMIVDLSYPQGRSVNDGINKHWCSLRYPSVDEAFQFILALGRNTLLIKIDLRNAYRMVPVHSQDRYLLGIRWRDEVFIDQALPFGLRSAPILFTAVSDAIGWALMQAGAPTLIHYLDDFLFFLPPTTDNGAATLSHILDTFRRLGVPVAMNKIEGPATSLTFVGIVVDISMCELRLPTEKLQFTRDLVTTWRRRRSGGATDFESFLGHLSHAATIIRQGRTFLRHMFEILTRAPSRHHFVHLDAEARADLLWWEYFLEHWNGSMFFKQHSTPMTHVYTDASGSLAVVGS